MQLKQSILEIEESIREVGLKVTSSNLQSEIEETQELMMEM